MKYYTPDDVARWEESSERSIAMQIAKLASETEPRQIDFRLGMLSLHYASRGMTHVAKGEFDAAVASFAESTRTRFRMYERAERGEGEALNADYFQPFLLSFVTRDEELVRRFARYYTTEDTPYPLDYLGRALKCLAAGDYLSAQQQLARRVVGKQAWLLRYADCLKAIADRDSGRFIDAVQAATVTWTKGQAQQNRGQPLTVCHIDGVALVKLAEKVIGARIEVTNEHLPPELLS